MGLVRGDGGKPRFYGIQVLRGVASVLVLLHHQLEVAVDRIPGTPHPAWMDNGAFGVDLFFPISGFVMYFAAGSLMRRRESNQGRRWTEFAWRRLVRVAPLYWIFTTLKLLAAFAVPSMMLHYRFKTWNAVASYFFVPSIGQSAQPLPVLPVGWTLNYEAFFYVLVAVAIAWRLPLVRWVGGALIAAALLGAVVPRSWGAWTFLGDAMVLEFLGGLLLARFLEGARRLPWVAGLVMAGAGMVFALQVQDAPALVFSPWRLLVWGVPGTLVVWGTLALEDKVKMARWRGALLLGDLSYALYLSHTFVLPAMAAGLHLQGARGLAWFTVLSTPVCLGVGWAVHRWMEVPMLRWMEGWKVSWVVRSSESVLP